MSTENISTEIVPFVPFNEQDKDIYSFTINNKTYKRDPFVVNYRYQEAAVNKGIDLKDLESTKDDEEDDPTKDYNDHRQMLILAELAAYALNIPLFNEDTGEGYTYLTIIKLWNNFNIWLYLEKKDIEDSPNT